MITLAPVDITKLAGLIGVTEDEAKMWADDLAELADNCLSGLDPTVAKKALFYFAAYYLSVGEGDMTSESLGDASMSFAARKGGMSASPYGKMALGLAPCLASLQPAKQYTAWLL